MSIFLAIIAILGGSVIISLYLVARLLTLIFIFLDLIAVLLAFIVESSGPIIVELPTFTLLAVEAALSILVYFLASAPNKPLRCILVSIANLYIRKLVIVTSFKRAE